MLTQEAHLRTNFLGLYRLPRVDLDRNSPDHLLAVSAVTLLRDSIQVSGQGTVAPHGIRAGLRVTFQTR